MWHRIENNSFVFVFVFVFLRGRGYIGRVNKGLRGFEENNSIDRVVALIVQRNYSSEMRVSS